MPVPPPQKISQVHLPQGGGGEGHLIHRQLGGIKLKQPGRLDGLGQAVPRPVQGGGGIVQGLVDVAPPAQKKQVNANASFPRLGEDLHHPLRRRQRFFQGTGYLIYRHRRGSDPVPPTRRPMRG